MGERMECDGGSRDVSVESSTLQASYKYPKSHKAYSGDSVALEV